MVTTKKTVKKTVKKEVKKTNVVDLWAEEIEQAQLEAELEPKEEKEEVKEEVKEEKKETKRAIGSIKGWRKVYQWIGTVKTQALRGPISRDLLPADIQRWLTNKWYGTNVYLKDKEWLERHNVDMSMVEKLKKFISDNYL
jgi:hypothetical protein